LAQIIFLSLIRVGEVQDHQQKQKNGNISYETSHLVPYLATPLEWQKLARCQVSVEKEFGKKVQKIYPVIAMASVDLQNNLIRLQVWLVFVLQYRSGSLTTVPTSSELSCQCFCGCSWVPSGLNPIFSFMHWKNSHL